MTAIDTTPIVGEQAAPALEHTVIVPAREPIVWPKYKEEFDDNGKRKKFKLPLPPPKVWEYRLADGNLYGAVARWDRDGDKTVLPCVYAEIDGEQRWAWMGFGNTPGCRPLLGLMELATKPLATVLVVEGEKARDAAPRWMPADWVCVTWQGGSKAVKYTNWQPLAGRKVVIWPDKDAAPIDPKTGKIRTDPKTGKNKLAAGEETARELMLLLLEFGCGVAQIPVYGSQMGMLPSNGWDLADPVPEGFNPTDWMQRAAAQIAMPAPPAELKAPSKPNGAHRPGPSSAPPESPSEPPRLTVKANGADPDGEYRCLGYSKEGNVPVFHIFSARSGFIVTQSAKELCNRNGVYNICNNDNFWRSDCDLPREHFEKIPWHHIGSVLMSKCYDAGYFRVDNERGRGAWIDDGRVVMHLGQTLIVDGQPINPAKMISEYYYPVSDNLMRPKGVPPLTDDEGRLLRKICRALKWQNPFFAELMGGWIATAPVCGAMPWRSHFWLQGESGAGKTWVVENIVKPCFGKLGYYPVGNSSAAGIMGSLRRDARPVVFDEAEGKGQRGIERRDMIIEMLRYSSSESESEVVKGTAGHGTVSFRVQSQYFLSSIGVGLTEAADRTRIVVCQLMRRTVHDASFDQLKAMVRQLPKDLPERLLRRQLKNLRVIRENADTLAQVITLQIGNRRIGDQIGTLMAGDFSLASDRKLTFQEAEQMVDSRMQQKRFDDFSQINEAKEDVDLLQHLASFVVRAQTRHGYSVDRTLGELMHVAAGKQADDKLDMDEADAVMRRLGIAYESIDGEAGFWIARAKTYVANEVMRRSAFAQGWDLVLKNHVSARMSDKQKSFGGFKLHAIWMPYDVLVGNREPEQDVSGE